MRDLISGEAELDDEEEDDSFDEETGHERPRRNGAPLDDSSEEEEDDDDEEEARKARDFRLRKEASALIINLVDSRRLHCRRGRRG